MPMKTYPMKVEDGKVYAELTLRDVVERCDVSDLPMLAEVKRLYDENAKLRWLVNGLTWCCENYGCDNRCQLYDESEPDDCCEQRLKRELGIEVNE